MNVQVDGRLIKALRIKHSYSQERLAEIVGVNLRTIQRIETTGVASLGTRGSLAKAFGVRPDELDLPKVHAKPAGGLPRGPILLLCVALIAVGWAVLAASIWAAFELGILLMRFRSPVAQ